MQKKHADKISYRYFVCMLVFSIYFFNFSNSIIIQLTSFRPTAEPSTIAMNRILAVLRGSL